VYYFSKSLARLELRHSHVEIMALAVVHVVQWLWHYVLLRKTKVITYTNPLQYVLKWCIIEGNYNKWIVILQEFDLGFEPKKSKNSLVFVEIISKLPRDGDDQVETNVLPENNFLIITSNDPFYKDMLVYLQTQRFASNLSHNERQRI